VLYELYDNHTHWNTNTDQSPPLIPSGTDIHVGYVGKQYVVLQLQPNSVASQQLMVGDVIESVNDTALKKAVQKRWPVSVRDHNNPEVHGFLANQIVAGQRGKPRKYQVTRNGQSLEMTVPVVNTNHSGLLTAERLDSNMAYIRINNSLGNQALVAAFDRAVNDMSDTAGLILDLRNTPSGGNTTVARSLMGRFINKPAYYQEHSIPGEYRAYGVVRRWTEKVYPRGVLYHQPMIVLVGNWTGSMGEGMTIGLHGMGRARIVGAPMAGLLGAQYNMQLPNTGIGVNYIAEKLYHVDGTPREAFKPISAEPEKIMQIALQMLSENTQ